MIYIYIYIYTSVDLCISMHRELWIRSCSDLAVELSVRRFVKCFVMYLDLGFVFIVLEPVFGYLGGTTTNQYQMSSKSSRK